MVLRSQREDLFSQSIIPVFGNAGFMKSNLHSLSTPWTLSPFQGDRNRYCPRTNIEQKYLMDMANVFMISVETIGCEEQEMIIKAE